MSIKMQDLLGGARDQLRYEPTEKRVRATLEERDDPRQHARDPRLGATPRRPVLAVPAEDIAAELEPATPSDEEVGGRPAPRESRSRCTPLGVSRCRSRAARAPGSGSPTRT